jgi:PTH1 family peptidyl-tRNA hydrolase
MIELVAFLGNPGREYAQTRHNAGRLLAAQIPFLSAVHWQRKYKGLYTFIEGNSLLNEQTGLERRTLPSKIHFLIPETYMNLSGNSVYEGASFFKIPPEQILVVHDELELSLGQGSLKFSGGLGGHNGLRSMKACFGTADFWRLRIGIGRPNHKDIASWVLSDFTVDEASVLERILDSCAGALIQALIQGPETLLPEWNKKKIVETVV